MRLSVVAASLSLCLIAISLANDARASIRKETNIPAEGLGPALNALAKDRNFQIIYVTEEIANVRTEGAVGEFTTEEALKKLLAGTGLTYRYLDDKTVTIRSANTTLEHSASGTKITSSGSPDATGANQEGKKSTSGQFRVAQVDQGKGSSASSVANQNVASPENSNSSNIGLSEIIVTAQKREERALDVPVALTAIDAQTLVNSNLLSIQDYYSQVPGINFSTGIFGEPQIAIRGLTTGLYTNPTVGIVLDDIPIGPTTALAGGYLVPDLDPSDLSQIEVLRGPQGTLYGANTLGGLVKFVTVDPSTSALTARAEVGTNNIAGSGTLGYTARGAINAPVTDVLAIRASGFYREDSGYVDDVESGQTNVNRTRTDGGRVAVFWEPAQDFSIKLSALYQEQKIYGSSESDISIGDLKQSTLGNTGLLDTRMQVYTATLKARVADVDIQSLSSYSIFGVQDSLDVSEALASFTGPNRSEQTDNRTTDKLTQEVRFSGQLGKIVDWRVGGYFSNEHTAWQQNYPVINPSTLASAATPLLLSSVPSTYKEEAGFADFTVHVTDRFKVEVGGREAESRQSDGPGYGTGVLAGTPGTPGASLRISQNAFTYLVTPSLQLSPDQMAYARVATGYRPGGPNNCQLLPVSCQYGSDKTTDYEVGLKQELLDHRMSVDASVYYIDWKNIALNLSNGIFSYYGNVGSAKSEGVEIQAEFKPAAYIKMSGWVAWNQAQLTANLPAESGIPGGDGDRLPGSARWSGNSSITVNHPLIGSVSGFATISGSYVGDRLPNIGAPGPQVFRSYFQFNSNGGLASGPWTANMYITNIANRRGVIGGGFLPTEYYFIKPRTVGLSISYRFGE